MKRRARLLGYYFRAVQRDREKTPQSIREARGRHVRWLIENEPRSELLSLSESFAMSGYLSDAENLAMARELWLKQVERYPYDLAVLRNASKLLQQGDRLLVLELMKRAYELSAISDRDASFYGSQLGLSLLGGSGDPNELHQRALQELDRISDPRVLGSIGATIERYTRDDSKRPTDAATESLARRLLMRALQAAPDHRAARRWTSALKRLDGRVRLTSDAEPAPAAHP